MTDQLERDLTTLFHDKASDTEASPVPLPRLVREGEAAMGRRRRHTRLVAVGGVAAAVVLAVAIPLGPRSVEDDPVPAPAGVPEVVNTSTERPDRVADLPTGPPPAVPYAVDDTLHFRGETYDIPAEATGFRDRDLLFQSAGDTVVLVGQRGGAREPAHQTYSVYVPRDGELVPIIEVAAAFPPILNADGSVLATFSSNRLTTYAVPSGEVLGTAEDVPPNRKLTLPVVDADGRVLWSSRPTYLWLPGAEPRQLDLPADSTFLAATTSGVLVEVGQEIVHGTVSDDGTFAPEWSFRLADGYGADVPGGSHVVWQPRYDTDEEPPGSGDRMINGPGWVADLTTGESTDLLVPDDVALGMTGGWTTLVGAEGDENLLFHGSRGGLRCSVATGACDRVLAHLPEDAVVTFSTDPTARSVG